jgi:hypothetical protein
MALYIRGSNGEGAWVDVDAYYVWVDMGGYEAKFRDLFVHQFVTNYKAGEDAWFTKWVGDHFKGDVNLLRQKWAPSDKHIGFVPVKPMYPPILPVSPPSNGPLQPIRPINPLMPVTPITQSDYTYLIVAGVVGVGIALYLIMSR